MKNTVKLAQQLEHTAVKVSERTEKVSEKDAKVIRSAVVADLMETFGGCEEFELIRVKDACYLLFEAGNTQITVELTAKVKSVDFCARALAEEHEQAEADKIEQKAKKEAEKAEKIAKKRTKVEG